MTDDLQTEKDARSWMEDQEDDNGSTYMLGETCIAAAFILLCVVVTILMWSVQ